MGSGDSSHNRRLWRLRLAAVTISLLLSLSVAEIVFRILDLRGFHAPRFPDWGRALVPAAQSEREGYNVRFKPYVSFEFFYESNPTGYFNERNGLVYRMNRFGLRGEGFPRKKPPDVQRILLLGDSFVFGEGVRFADTTGEQLENLLNAQGRGRFEVINAGTSGWSTVHEVTFLRREGADFEPDIVMIGYVLNDAVAGVDLWEQVRRTYEKRALRSSYLVSYVYGAIAKRTLTRAYIEEMVTAARDRGEEMRSSFDSLEQAKLIADRIGARFIVFIYPFLYDLSDTYPFAELHARVVEFCTAEGIEVLDLFPSYAGYRDTSLWAHPHSDPHPNPLGHRIAAEALARYLWKDANADEP